MRLVMLLGSGASVPAGIGALVVRPRRELVVEGGGNDGNCIETDDDDSGSLPSAVGDQPPGRHRPIK